MGRAVFIPHMVVVSKSPNLLTKAININKKEGRVHLYKIQVKYQFLEVKMNQDYFSYPFSKGHSLPKKRLLKPI